MDGLWGVGLGVGFVLWMMLRAIADLKSEIVSTRAQLERFELKMDRQFDHVSDCMGKLRNENT